MGLMSGWMRGRSNRRGRIIDHELDMLRMPPGKSITPNSLMRMLRGLKPSGALVGAPMRSVDRDLEDRWPSGNRQT